MSVEEACETAIAAATHIDAEGADAGAVAALLALARKVDAWDVIVQWAIIDVGNSGARPKVPVHDNVSLGSLLKYCDALGLTTVSRNSLLGAKVKPEGVDPIDELKAKRKRKVAKASG